MGQVRLLQFLNGIDHFYRNSVGAAFYDGAQPFFLPFFPAGRLDDHQGFHPLLLVLTKLLQLT